MPAVPLIVRLDPDDPGAAELYVDVQVNGRPLRMLLDTGAATSRIPANEATRALTPAAADKTPGRGALGHAGEAAKRVVVPSIEVGGVRAESLVVELADPAEDRLAAILGLDVLRSHRLDVRMSDSTLAVDAQSAVATEHPLVQSSRGHPHVDVEFSQGVGVRAIWDTGAATTVVDRAFARAHPALFTAHGTSKGIDSVGNSLDVPMMTMEACVIGGVRFGPSLAAVVDIAGIQRSGDPDFEMIIGYPLICQADWAVDLKRGWWGLLR